jgi:site-specific DNA-methyltransferase (adenine-specific)
MKLLQGNCLEVMKDIPDKSVDMILCDLPYGTTACKWDNVIPFDLLWEQYNRVIKDNGAMVLFSKQPFTTELIHSNLKLYKYSLVWKKDNHDNPLMAKKRFLNITEDINVFYKGQCTYNPQGIVRVNKVTKQGRGESLSQKNARSNEYLQEYTNYPRNILEFKRDLPNIHPTQKPVELLEYLIKTYTNEGETVLDNCMGSGSTGVACKNTNRDFIGIELDNDYFNLSKQRIELA